MPRVFVGSPWQQFKSKWENCSNCSLCEVRKNIVLCKGKVPCDVLFVGEAPGLNEDALGIPFVGPAGKLLDQQIGEALVNSCNEELRVCFTNLVCCIPKINGRKTGEPPKETVAACSARLDEFLCLCKPRMTVAVGDLAKKNLAELADVSITHPAAILRAEIVRKDLMDHKVVVILENALREI